MSDIIKSVIDVPSVLANVPVKQIACPVCNVSAELDDVDGIYYHCPCRKASFTTSENIGWSLHFSFVQNVKHSLHLIDRDFSLRVNTLLQTIIPDEMKVLDASLDKTIVKLYCPNEKCPEEGFLTRTKALAEKMTFTCDTCHNILQW